MVQLKAMRDSYTATLKGWSRTRLSKMFELVAEVSPQKSHQDAFSFRSMLKLWYATCLNSSWREIPDDVICNIVIAGDVMWWG